MKAPFTLLDELQAAVITTPPSKLLELVRRAAQEIAVLQERAGAAKRAPVTRGSLMLDQTRRERA